MLEQIRSTRHYARAHELWQDSMRNVASTLVSLGTWLVAWIVLTEVLYRIALVNRLQGDISVARLIHAIGIPIGQELPPDPLFGASLVTLACFAGVAFPIVCWIFRLGGFLVGVDTPRENDPSATNHGILNINQEQSNITYGTRDKRHVAYAWASGILGLLCVLSETVDFLEFSSEDLLLGMSALNMLVEEIRMLEGKANQPDHPEPSR